MSPRSASTDRRPGAPPQIRAEGNHVVFEFAVTIRERRDRKTRLRLRCTDNGELLAAIDHTHGPRRDSSTS
jgi:hypothetical protein